MNNSSTFIGIDIGKKANVVCFMDDDGNVLKTSNYLNRRDSALSFFTHVKKKYPNCIATYESTANMWLKTAWALEKCGIPYKMANTLRLKLSKSGLKTDKIDARHLANYLRMGEIPEAHVYPADVRRVIDILNDRINLVRIRTQIINRQHSIMDKYDHQTSGISSDTASSTFQDYLDGLKFGEGDMRRMAMHVQFVRFINEQISILERMIAKEALENEDAKIIMTMMGFEAFSALLVATAIDGIGRFPKPRHLVSFMGLCPRIYQSGDTTRYGRMKKAANRNLTWVMVHAAVVAVQHDLKLKARYAALRKRHPRAVAYSHIANYQARCMHQMLKRREPYKHYNKASYERKLKTVRNRSK